jgi:hypothetical protein
MTTPLTVECDLRRLGHEKRPPLSIAPHQGRVPRISRLLALAIRMEDLLRAHAIADYSKLAQLGHVSRARITQIMNLRLLAPDIQEQILFLAPTRHGRDPIRLAQLQPLARILDWNRQRSLWKALVHNRLGSSFFTDWGGVSQKSITP